MGDELGQWSRLNVFFDIVTMNSMNEVEAMAWARMTPDIQEAIRCITEVVCDMEREAEYRLKWDRETRYAIASRTILMLTKRLEEKAGKGISECFMDGGNPNATPDADSHVPCEHCHCLSCPNKTVDNTDELWKLREFAKYLWTMMPSDIKDRMGEMSHEAAKRMGLNNGET